MKHASYSSGPVAHFESVLATRFSAAARAAEVVDFLQRRAHKGWNELIKVHIRQSTDPQQRMACRALLLDRHAREQRATALALNSHRVVSVEAIMDQTGFFQ